MKKEFSIDYTKVHPGILQLKIAEDRALGRGMFAPSRFYETDTAPAQEADPELIDMDVVGHYFLASRNGTYDEELIDNEIHKYVETVSGQVILGEKKPPQISYNHQRTLGIFLRDPHRKLTQHETIMFHVISAAAPEGFYSLPKPERNRVVGGLETMVDTRLRIIEEAKKKKK